MVGLDGEQLSWLRMVPGLDEDSGLIRARRRADRASRPSGSGLPGEVGTGERLPPMFRALARRLSRDVILNGDWHRPCR